jgi:hypothetical protein
MLDDEDYAYITECYDLRMLGLYVHCKPKKKFKGMGLRANTLQKVLMNPERTGRKINVDHKDGNENNYQKENLRVCTHLQNSYNRRQQGGTSKYKGVHWNSASELWKVKIQSDGKYKGLGRFTNEIAAANCYNYFAKLYHGEFALLNNVPFMEKEEWMKFKKEKNKSSLYRGVSKYEGKWVAQLWHDGKSYNLGTFADEYEAAKAYNRKAIELKGEKAVINKIT